MINKTNQSSIVKSVLDLGLESKKQEKACFLCEKTYATSEMCISCNNSFCALLTWQMMMRNISKQNEQHNKQKHTVKCQICGIDFPVSRFVGQRYCSKICKRQFQRRNMRVKRARSCYTNIPVESRKCILCGYNETTRIYYINDNEIVVLCPNHYDLIHKGKKTFEELLNNYNIVDYSKFPK